MDATPGGLLAGAALVIGVITGLATIIGWIVSADLAGTITTTGKVAATAFVVYTLAAAALFAVLQAVQWPRRIWQTLIALAYVAAGILTIFLISWPDWVFQIVGALAALILLLAIAAELNRWREDHHRLKRKTCPDCAETIKKEANVCRYCGYRFNKHDSG